jgi:esterase/lipase
MTKNQVFTKQNKAVFSNLHCFVGTTEDMRKAGTYGVCRSCTISGENGRQDMIACGLP